jgi:hypothetical protein
MSSSKLNPDSNFDEAERIVLQDEQGRSLECYIENTLETDDFVYLLLTPVDTPVVILAFDDDEDGDEDISDDALILEDSKEIDPVFADAKAVLSEQNLTLQYTAYSLTVSGELPPIEDESILSLELESDDDDDEESEETEELQYLASFYSQDQKYSIYTPLTALLFVATYDQFGQVKLVSPDEEDIQPILEELLFEEGEL